MKELYFALILAVFAGVAPTALFGDIIQASSQLGNTTTFDVLLSGAPVTFNAGSTITVTGLSGVTDANPVGYAGYYGTLTHTATSVIYQLATTMSFAGGAPSDLAVFTITSTDPLPSQVAFAMQEAGGTVAGPVSVQTPEPASLVLLGTGLTGMLCARRLRFPSRARVACVRA